MNVGIKRRATSLLNSQDKLHVFAARFSTPLGKTRHWEERFKINKIAKFESDLLKTNEDMTTQGREILQAFK